ncbi:conserved hypothetical protein [Vibrio nigripulchritudo SFn27]|nr:M15 family metallopeptidase [Vibrio nigripulchritudo]CCN89057.1 conserved hypothetical protein [Vibrio nigripulchritudo SFn27]CCN95443.1 conserved hypothetical protein [Vibrio nigripulchritudo ENn2]CCO43200.1 conserved hypothetical protein [Vibrio nigripulchritudo SFn135]CCO54514.1 conserved hypothetical protein [Vibrio nigripulchritudo Wn13]CCN85474.1 conserved hypothetical protein [Vibrio nigripulchritudo BLFn1]
MRYALALIVIGAFLMHNRKAVSKWALSARSEARMMGVKTELKEVVRLALTYSRYDFGITSGVRTAKEQNELYLKNASQLDGYQRKSKHQTGDAIDFVAYDENGRVTWDFRYYEAIADAFKRAASELKTPIVWGGDWRTFKDGPHIELARSNTI